VNSDADICTVRKTTSGELQNKYNYKLYYKYNYERRCASRPVCDPLESWSCRRLGFVTRTDKTPFILDYFFYEIILTTITIIMTLFCNYIYLSANFVVSSGFIE